MIVNQQALLKAQPIKNMLNQKVQAKPTSYGLTECGYDLRLAEDIIFEPNKIKLFSEGNSFISFDNKHTWKKEKGLFILASAIEEFQMPDNLMATLLNKSTWARQGVDVSMTTNIEPGWRGTLTLEIKYSGVKPLYIPKGCGIVQVIFHEIMEAAQYKGKYQDQRSGPVQAK